jgi:hypothetical protein
VTGLHYWGVHLHHYNRDRVAIDPITLPAAPEVSHGRLNLPFRPGLSEADPLLVIRALFVALGPDCRLYEPTRL